MEKLEKCVLKHDSKSNIVRENMRSDIRSMCGLGYPPAVYTQNANECKNRFIKEDVTGQGRQPMKNLLTAVDRIQQEINRQFDEHFLAVIGKGEYRLRQEFVHLGVAETQFYRMTSNHKCSQCHQCSQFSSQGGSVELSKE